LKLTAASWTTEQIGVRAEELGRGGVHRVGRFAGSENRVDEWRRTAAANDEQQPEQ
jgi:hypothetical protein